MDNSINNSLIMNQQMNPEMGEKSGVPYFKLLLLAVIILIVGSGIFAFLKFGLAEKKYSVDKSKQFQQTYDSLPLQIVTTDAYFGSGTTPLPKCGNGKIYKSLDEVRSETVNKVCILALDYKELKEIPDEVLKLSDLEFIFLRHNSLNKFPIELLKLPHLKGIDITGNQITDIPKEVGISQSLIIIVAGENKIPSKKAQSIRESIRPTLLLQF